MKEDEALIWKWLCSPTSNPERQTVKWRAQSASIHLSVLIEAWPSISPPLSVPYLRFTARSLGSCHTKISTRSLTTQQGGSTMALELHIVLADRLPGPGRTADTNILITRRLEGFRRG